MSERIEPETLRRILERLGEVGDVCGKYTGRVLRRPVGEMTPMERLCLAVLTDEAREGQDVVWLSTRQIAERMGTTSIDTVQRMLKALQARGLARVRRGRHGTSGWRLPSWVTTEPSTEGVPTSGTPLDNSIVDNSGVPTSGTPRTDQRYSSVPISGTSSVYRSVTEESPSRLSRSETLSPAAPLAPLRSPDGFATLAAPLNDPGPNGARSGRSGHDIEEVIMRRSGNPEEDHIAEEAERRAREMDRYIRGSPNERIGILVMLRDEVRAERRRRPESEPAPERTPATGDGHDA